MPKSKNTTYTGLELTESIRPKRQIEIKIYLPLLLPERRNRMKEIYKVKIPERIVFGDPMYFEH